ncbi:MAG: hypothetical protein LAO05_13575, partial [Acidobacteriia bacterium]|nr:hypothetical protein [Terriglobia bacterium]
MGRDETTSGCANPAMGNTLGGGNYLTHGRGLKSWLLTLDHKRIGVMYLTVILASFFLGGMFAELIRTKLLTPGNSALMKP